MTAKTIKVSVDTDEDVFDSFKLTPTVRVNEKKFSTYKNAAGKTFGLYTLTLDDALTSGTYTLSGTLKDADNYNDKTATGLNVTYTSPAAGAAAQVAAYQEMLAKSYDKTNAYLEIKKTDDSKITTDEVKTALEKLMESEAKKQAGQDVTLASDVTISDLTVKAGKYAIEPGAVVVDKVEAGADSYTFKATYKHAYTKTSCG